MVKESITTVWPTVDEDCVFYITGWDDLGNLALEMQEAAERDADTQRIMELTGSLYDPSTDYDFSDIA